MNVKVTLVTFSKQTYLFAAGSEEEKKEWIAEIMRSQADAAQVLTLFSCFSSFLICFPSVFYVLVVVFLFLFCFSAF